MMLSRFSCAYWPFVFLGRNVFKSFGFNCVISLFIAELLGFFIYSGSKSLIRHIIYRYSHSAGSPFTFLMVSFEAQKFLKFESFGMVTNSNLPILVFCHLGFCCVISYGYIVSLYQYNLLSGDI